MIRRAIMAIVISTMDTILPGEFHVISHWIVEKNWIGDRVDAFLDFGTDTFRGKLLLLLLQYHSYSKISRMFSYIVFIYYR